MKFIRSLFKGREKKEEAFDHNQIRGIGSNPSSKSQSPGIPGREKRGLCGSSNYGVATKPTTTTLSPGIPGASRKRCFVEDKDGNRVEFMRGKHRYY